METESVQQKSLFCVGILVALFLLGGCGATQQAQELAECSSTTPETCEAQGEEGKDRSYDPCLINNKLPVCQN